MKNRIEYINETHILKETSQAVLDLICKELGLDDTTDQDIGDFASLLLNVLSYSMVNVIEIIYEEEDLEKKLMGLGDLFDAAKISLIMRNKQERMR